MSTIQRTIFSGARRLNPSKSLSSSYSLRRSFTQRLVKVNDVILLKPETNEKSLPTLTKPLKHGDSLVFRDHRKVKADDVIGKPYRSVVAGGRRALFRVYEPTLGEYCDNAPRIVTPIYSQDANLIVSLLDINFVAVPSPQSEIAEEREKFLPNRPLVESVVSKNEETLEKAAIPEESETEESEIEESVNWKPEITAEESKTEESVGSKPEITPGSESSEFENISDEGDLLEDFKELPGPSRKLTDAELLEDWDSVKHDENKLEIFEAGTGAGSLTLHLARAIHGANTRAPPIPKLPKTKSKVNPDDDIYRYGGKFGERNDKMNELYNEWRSQRRAVIHSLDLNENHSRHAQRTIRNYRHGAYFPHIDFHVGTIHSYLSKRLEQTQDVFLDHAILDIPAIQDEMEIVGKCLKPNGRLVTWCPSITQHMKCLEAVKSKKLHFVLDRVLELGSQLSTGGREWEVRSVKPRALIKAEMKANEERMAEEDIAEAASAVDKFLARVSMDEKSNEESKGKKKGKGNGEIKSSAGMEDKLEPNEGVKELANFIDMSKWETICRPKVGDRITGGGFVGVWKKMDMKV
ncbi:ebbf0ab2-92d8-48ce-840b-b256193153db [Sclerotinia trifoliorum]|uniref:tRNA (adenine(58)-N(1))-methyltransferase catalytic subunit TRM61 n=1 Tax=Sclerotinia trifoliorum TaxID=28548 RepID=A0A8H2W608_9HELO|nr:ebbf0ab2-92d8-48ce-840b-b256193153db [Sclerotinia trifoliorum]